MDSEFMLYNEFFSKTFKSKEEDYEVIKMKKKKKYAELVILMLVAILMFLITVQSALSLPLTLDQQGILRNSTTGALISGTYEFNTTIYNTTNNNILYSETKNISVSNGVWDNTIGLVTTLSAEYFNYNTYVITKINGEALPALNLTSVPYAFYALKSNDTSYLNGQNAAYYLDDTKWNITESEYFYNNSGVLTINETKLNNSISALSGTSFNYTAFFNQFLNTTNNVTFLLVNSTKLIIEGNSSLYNVYPAETLKYDLGSGALRWNNLYVTNISGDNINIIGNITADTMNITTTIADYMYITTINASYIYNPDFPGYMDLRANPWYLGGANLEVQYNVTASNFFGNLNASNIQNSPWALNTSVVSLIADNTSQATELTALRASNTSIYTIMNTLNITATAANTTANLANTTANLANTTANLANTTANLANATANLANTTANAFASNISVLYADNTTQSTELAALRASNASMYASNSSQATELTALRASNITKAMPGVCEDGYAVQNTTTGGVQCVRLLSNYCYQESANIENQTGVDGNCGLLYAGSYAVYVTGNAVWGNVSYTTDGNWDTYGLEINASGTGLQNLSRINITYMKPNNALSSSKIQARIGISPMENKSIPSECWNAYSDKIIFVVMSSNSYGGIKMSLIACYDASWSATNIFSAVGSEGKQYIYEEAMYWDISTESDPIFISNNATIWNTMSAINATAILANTTANAFASNISVLYADNTTQSTELAALRASNTSIYTIMNNLNLTATMANATANLANATANIANTTANIANATANIANATANVLKADNTTIYANLTAVWGNISSLADTNDTTTVNALLASNTSIYTILGTINATAILANTTANTLVANNISLYADNTSQSTELAALRTSNASMYASNTSQSTELTALRASNTSIYTIMNNLNLTATMANATANLANATANIANATANVLKADNTTIWSNLSAVWGNISLSAAGNPFDQVLNATSNATFNKITLSSVPPACPDGNIFTYFWNGSNQLCKALNESLFNISAFEVDSRYYLDAVGDLLALNVTALQADNTSQSTELTALRASNTSIYTIMNNLNLTATMANATANLANATANILVTNNISLFADNTSIHTKMNTINATAILANATANLANATANIANATANVLKADNTTIYTIMNNLNLTATMANATANLANATANAALPKAGGVVTGSINVSDNIKIFLGTDADVYIFFNSTGGYGELG